MQKDAMRKTKERDEIAKGIKAWIYAIVALSGVLVGAFLVRFATWPIKLSQNTTDWGVFGDYVGGTIGTVFAFAAFMGVLATIVLQWRQTSHSEEQARREDVQRLIVHCSERLDALLYEKAPVLSDRLRQVLEKRAAFVSFYELLAGLVAQKAGAVQGSEEQSEDLLFSVSHARPLILIELNFLTACLKSFIENEGTERVVELYRLRYGQIVAWMHFVSPLRDEVIEGMFNPAEAIQIYLATVAVEMKRSQA